MADYARHGARQAGAWQDEVIAAIATPPGRGGIGVVRISGLRLESTLRALVRTEVEMLAEDFDSARKFLEALGYHAVISYEKFGSHKSNRLNCKRRFGGSVVG